MIRRKATKWAPCDTYFIATITYASAATANRFAVGLRKFIVTAADAIRRELRLAVISANFVILRARAFSAAGESHNSLRGRVLSWSAYLYIYMCTTSAKIYGHLKAMPPPGYQRPTFSGALRYVQHEKKTKRSICEIEIYRRARTLQADCLSFRNEV